MNTSFKQFKSKFMKMSLAMTVVVSTCSLAYGTVVNSGDIVVESVPSADGDNSIIQDNVNPEKVVEKIKAKSVFNKKENIIRLEWDSSKKENKYKVYRLAAEEDLNKNNKEDIREINKKKFILLKEIQECELEIENTYKPNAPKINIPKEYTDEIEITIENEELPLIHSYYIESIDEDGDVVEKTEEIKVGLENTIKGYSYVINSKEDDEPNEKVDTKKNTIKIKLGYEKKYLHIRAIDINGVAGESVTIELPEAVSREDNSQITKIVRTNQINHNIKPSDWTNKDVDINIHAISKKGFKQIVYPDGIIEDLTTSGLHLYGGEGRDDFKNVAPTKDGGFIAVGESNSSTFNGEKLSLAGGMDAIIVKYDEGGNVEWVKTWGRTGADAFHGVTEVVKNNKVVGYVAVGESNTENTYNSVVVRFDVNGNKVWEDIIPGVAVNEVLWDVIQDSAGRIVTAGWHTSNVKDDRDGIIRIYELDSPQAIKVVTSPYDIPSENKWFSEGYDAIKEVPDGYVVVGSSREWNVSSRIYEPRVGRIVKFDKELNVVWNKSFKGAYNLDKEMDFDNVVLTSDGNVVVVGDGSVDKGEDVLEEAKGDRDGFIIKFNIKDGSIIWSKRFGGSGEEQMYGIQERSNGDLVVIGETSSSDKDFSGTIKEPNEMKLDDVFVMTFAGDTGEKVGAVTRIGGKGNDIGWAIRTLNDGRLVSVGTTTSGQSQGNDAFVCFIKGTTDINAKYTVSENGTYKFKFADVSNVVHDYSVTVSNIDKEPPQIVLSSKVNNGAYKINANITDNAGIAVQKWAEGERNVDHFKENGNVFTGSEIEIGSKNTYTVYARDLAGNESREVIKLQDGGMPSINLSAKANHRENYIDLSWASDVDSYIYKAYGRKLGDKEFQPVSSVDFDGGEKVKVLQIYPPRVVYKTDTGYADREIEKETYTTWTGENVTLPKSARLKRWMEEPIPGYPKGYGKGLFDIDAIEWNEFLRNPSNTMKDVNGEWKYDVIVYGIWDSNGVNYDLNAESVEITKEFLDSGRGVLFGHDTMREEIPWFSKLKEYLNLSYYPDNGSTIDDLGDVKVRIKKEGLLVKYPYDIGSKGTILNIPLTHNVYQEALGDVWMEFAKRESGGRNFYLTSWKNAAFIQTGHSNGEATDDEQKVLANTLFYLKQLTDKTEAEDRNAMDLEKPTKPTVKSDVVRKFSLTRGFEQNISLELSSTDKGTTYEHYVEGLHKSDYSNKIVSNTTVTTITSGVKGYSYVIDKNKTTEPDGAIDTTGKVIDVEINPGDVKYVHVKAIDYAGNESETLHFEVKLPGLMTDYILSNANIKDGKGVKVNKLLRKGEYKYSFDVSNLAGTAFVSTFGGSKDEHIYKTILDEGSYISVGNTYSNDYTFNGMGRGNSDAFIVKYDNKGELIWKKVFGGSKDDYFTSIKKVDGGYIVTGHSASLDGSMADVKNAGDRDAVIIKYDYEGNIIWKTVVGGTASDDVHDVVQTKDGGYLIVGGYGKIHNTNGLGYILKLDKNGKVEFEKKYGGSGTDEFQNIISNEDGTYTIIGYTSSPNAFGASKGGQDGVLLHIDEKGNIIKQKRYGGSGEDLFRTISRSSDGELYIGGYTHSKDGDLLNIKTTTTRDGLVIKLDKNWNVHWVKSWGGTNGAEYFLASYATGDGIVMSGFGTSTDGALSGNNGAEDAMIVKFNENGNCEWERNFGGSGSERLRTIVETPEGGYLIGGDSSSNDGLLSGKNKGNADALLVKFNPDGSLGLMPNDDEISEISYKIETDKSGVRRVIKQGEFTSVIVKPSQTIKKEISFNVPNEEIDKLVFTAMLVDKQDSNMSNNKVVIEVPIYKGKDTDFSLSNDKVVDVNGGTPTELEIAKEYTYKFDVSNWDTTPFIKTFGGTGNEHFEKHIITSDGGIVAVGRTGSSDKDLKGMNKGNNDALIVKYDQHGNVEWKDSYGGKESDMFYQAMELSDGSIVAVGQKSGKDNLIVKYTKDGKFIWERVYRDSQVSSTRVTNAIVDENDNMYLVDTGYSGSTYLSDPAYSKWDKNGNRIWRKFLNQYGESGTTTIYGIDLANNGDLFLTGKYAASNGSFAGLPNRGGTEGFVAKVSSNNGAIRWITGISGSDHDDTRQVAEDEDGNVIVIGRTVSGDGHFNGLKKPLKNGNYASGSLASDAYYKRQDGFMAKLSSTGRLQKIKVIGGGAYDNLRYLSKMKDGKFLVAGDTASTDGDFANRRVMDKGYTDTVWMKINKDLNIEWVSILGGDNDDATQSSIELPDGSIVVAGETKSTTGDFAGLNKGGQDAFIARLNEEGKLDVLPYDEMIGSIDYDVSWSDGKNLYPIKSGSFYNEEVPVGVTKQKSIKFTVPRESKIKSVVVSAEIVDRNDLNPANNRVEKSINVIKPYDYTIKAYNVKETNKSELIGTLRKGRSYDLNIKLRNQLMGIDEDSRAFSISDLFGGNVAKASQGNIESFKYKILTTDGLNPQNVNDITFDNVKGTVLAKGERKNLAIEEGGDRWEKITFKTLDDDDMAEVIFVAQIEALDDADLTNNKLVVKLPIVNHEDPEISIKSIEVYPDSATGDNKLLIGNETNVKVKLTSNELRSNNVNVKLTVEQNGKKSVLEKYAYGVSKENPGVVYFKYKPQDIGQVKVVAEIDTLGKKKQSDPVYATVGRSEDVSNYKHAPVKDSDKYNISSSVVTYVKSNKRDKDVVKVRYCASAKDCQEDFNGRVKCPGHEYFDWGDWYEAYVPIKSTELTGFEEWYEIKKVMFRSKQTEMYKNSSNNNVDQDGYVDLLDEEGSKLAIVKAGYGFDMKVETEYKNNAPSLFEKAYTQNRVPQDTRWSKYNVIPHGEARIPFIYYASNGKSIDDEIQSVRGVVSFTVPSLNDVIFENPDQLYMEMPDGKFAIVDEGYGENYGDKVDTILRITNNSKTKIIGNVYSDIKEFELKSNTQEGSEKRQYYVDSGIKDGDYGIKIFNRYSGYGPSSRNKLHLSKDVKIKVKGTRYEDLIDRPFKR